MKNGKKKVYEKRTGELIVQRGAIVWQSIRPHPPHRSILLPGGVHPLHSPSRRKRKEHWKGEKWNQVCKHQWSVRVLHGCYRSAQFPWEPWENRKWPGSCVTRICQVKERYMRTQTEPSFLHSTTSSSHTQQLAQTKLPQRRETYPS
jgi:hypothetical protein